MSISPEKYNEKYDLTGKCFGRLVVLERAEPPPDVKYQRATYWRCQCDCGNVVVIRRNSLTSGIASSCGCYKKDVNSERKKMNVYWIHGDITSVFDESGHVFIIDTEDIENIKQLYWKVHPHSKHAYVEGWTNNTRVALHRVLMGVENGDVVDHINHDSTDNRKCNLRTCTQQDNCRNKSLPCNNRSGVIGACQEKNGKWRAYITINNCNYKLYNGNDMQRAAFLRLCAEAIFFGNFAPQKHLFALYGVPEHLIDCTENGVNRNPNSIKDIAVANTVLNRLEEFKVVEQ